MFLGGLPLVLFCTKCISLPQVQDTIPAKGKEGQFPSSTKSQDPRNSRPAGKKKNLVPVPKASVSDSQEGMIDRLPSQSQSRKAGLRPLHSSPMPSVNSAIGQVSFET